MSDQHASADGRSMGQNLKDLGNVVKSDYADRGGNAPSRDQIKSEYNDAKATAGDYTDRAKQEARSRAPDGQDLKGRAKEEADMRTDGGTTGAYKEKAANPKELMTAQARQSRGSQDEDSALVDKIPDTMVSKVADMLSNALGNGRLFEEYLGQSAWAAELVAKGTSFKKKDDKVKQMAKKAPEAIQEEREALLAKLLKQRLLKYTEGDEAGFRSHVQREVHELAKLPFGIAMLHCIGYCYGLAGQEHSGVGGKVSTFFKGGAHRAGKSIKDDISKVNVGMMYLDIRGMKDKKTQHTSLMEVADYLEKRVGWVITHLFNLITEDAEHTLRNVCKLMFSQDDGSKKHTKALAAALTIMADEFKSIQSPAGGPHMPSIPLLSGGGEKRNPQLDQSGRQAGEQVASKADPAADKAISQGVQPGVQKVQQQAGPQAQKFTDEQMMPAAQKVSDQARPQADKFNQQAIDPAASAVEQNARPMADKAIDKGIQPGAQAIAQNAVPMTDKFIEQGLRPGAETVANKAQPVAAELMQNQVLPRMKQGESVDGMAKDFTSNTVMPQAQQVADQLPGAAENFNSKLQEQTEQLLAKLQRQAVDIEREGPGIIERLPQALFKAVARNAVPDDLERDVNALAEWLEPQIPTLVEKAKHAEAGIDQLSEKTQGTVDKVQDQVQQGADQASEKIVPMAADASRTINSAAEDLAKEAGPNADKLNAKVMDAADQVSKNAIPVAQDLEKNLRFQARDASENAEDVGNVLSDKLRQGADTAASQARPTADKAKSAVSQGADQVAEQAVPRAKQAGEGLQGAADQAAQKAPEVGGKMEDGIRSGAQQTKDKAPQAGGAAGERANDAAMGGDTGGSSSTSGTGGSSTYDKMRKGGQW